MAAMGNMGVGIPGDPMMAGAQGIDTGGMGVPPVPIQADPKEVMMQALMAVLGKWDSNEQQLAGEQNSLMQTLMLIASAQPPSAAEAAVMGGDPAGYGMDPTADMGMV